MQGWFMEIMRGVDSIQQEVFLLDDLYSMLSLMN
ncbi:MAG: hypothetical protein IJG51_06865 [Synergistaceae bacterium]|nr:hypothetical protein [Synergistaceae bacterium]MBQ6418237.1 hypothetical protein [Synergistaceae bacterium]MBQ6665534.1 hypothetical protein [Synergistaceae bacterium]MBR0248220.1 hypothetical protein [Synergistaceae bacterium]